jgi:hypothetical protein
MAKTYFCHYDQYTSIVYKSFDLLITAQFLEIAFRGIFS